MSEQRRTGPARWVLACAVFAAVMGASLSLKGVLQDFSWLPQATFVVAVTALFPALLRGRTALSPYAPLGALVGWMLSLTVLFFPGTAILGFIPTTTTLSALVDMSRQASTVISSHVAPVPSEPSMIFLVAVGLGFAALLIDTAAITLAMPAAGALGIVLVMLPSAFLTAHGLGTPAFIAAAIGYLILLGCCRWYAPEGILRSGGPAAPSGTLGRAAFLGAAVVLLMAIVPALVPGFTNGSFPQGARLNAQQGVSRLDPMISLGTSLRDQSNRVSLTYLSNTNTAQYIRLSTLEDFTGKSWRPSKVPDGLTTDLSNLSPAAGPDPDVPRTETLTLVRSEGLDSDWLPAPLSVTRVEDLDGKWRWNPSTATINSASDTTLNANYLVHSEMPELTRARLAAATAAPRAGLDPVFSALPEDVPASIRTTAEDLAKNATTPYQKAMALQDYFRSDAFTYSLDTPASEGYDGSGMTVLAAFLQAKSGYCVHFSAAMAVMARELGIPSRIAVGYAPGASNLETTEVDGATLFGYQAAGRDAHAWPELYFEGLGWVPFEPTPSRGSVPDYAEAEANTSTDANDLPLPDQPAATTTAPTATPTPSATAVAGAATPTNDDSALLRGALVLLLILVLLTPAMLRVNVRRRHLAQVRRGGHAGGGFGTGGGPGAGAPEVIAWRELLATAVDYGYVPDPSRTPALHAEKIAAMLGSSAPAGVALLRSSYERSVYGSPVGGSLGGGSLLEADQPPGSAGREDLAEALEVTWKRFHSRAPLTQRLRARFVPASFFRRL